MRTLASLALAAAAAMTLASCSCNGCGGYNPDYLRDVPTERTQYFQ